MEPIDLGTHPGHLARRLQQVIHALWTGTVSEETTSPQFAVLTTLHAEPDIDQRTLGERASLDRSTVADVVARLTRRGLVERVRDARDGRRNVLRLSAAGEDELGRLLPRTRRMNHLVLSALESAERDQFLGMLHRLVQAGETLRHAEPGRAEPDRGDRTALSDRTHLNGAAVPSAGPSSRADGDTGRCGV